MADDSEIDQITAQAVCRHLRTKSYYYFSPSGMPFDPGDTTTQQVWCLKTMRVIGPDGRVVLPKRCRSGRECFEAQD